VIADARSDAVKAGARWTFLCREDAELVERYNEREGVKFE
jgi:hypothetical protein